MGVSESTRSRCGKARNRSIRRLMTMSTFPPKKPAAAPRIVPSTTETSVASSAIVSDTWAP